MKLLIHTVRRRQLWRNCKHVQDPLSVPPVELIWAELKRDDELVVTRCMSCLFELCGFSPLYGRMLNRDHVCEVCGDVGKAMKLSSTIPYPGVRKVVCIKCFEAIGMFEPIQEGDGGIIGSDK